MIELNEQGGGTVFRVRVLPGAMRSRVVGEYGGALKVSVVAPPERGKANRALCDLLAEVLGVTRRQVEVIAGEVSRDKLVRVNGIILTEMRKRMERLTGGPPKRA
jgi:uncharacterized protein (TIGR00251 family)